METQLRTKPKRPAINESRLPQNVLADSNLRVPSIDSNGSVPQGTNMQGSMDGYLDTLGEGISKVRSNVSSDASLVQDMNAGFEPTVSWEMIGLGLEEPLPTQQAIDEL